METRHSRDSALDAEVLEALTRLEAHVNHVSGAGAYVLEMYFGWPGLPDGTKLPDALADRFAELSIKMTSNKKMAMSVSGASSGVPSTQPINVDDVEAGEGGGGGGGGGDIIVVDDEFSAPNLSMDNAI